MAEKREADQAPVQNLTCLLCHVCLDIFDEATILTSCGHTFCGKCLKNYDLSHQDLGHMICPLCRKITKLAKNRVADLPSNVMVNGLVDDYHIKRRGVLKGAAGLASAGVVTQKTQKNHADDCRLDLRNISETHPKLQSRWVNVTNKIYTMTKYSDDSVAVVYGDTRGIDIISSAGYTQRYIHVAAGFKCFDVLFQQDRSVCIRTGHWMGNEVHVYSSKGSMKSTITVPGRGFPYLSKSPSDEIIVTKNGNHVYIYDSTGTTLRHTFQAKHKARQAPTTSSGLIVVSWTRDYTPSVVTVHDRDGNAGQSLQSPRGVYLYAVVDEQDRVYVASVHGNSGRVVIRLYDIDGLDLKEKVKFNELNLELNLGWVVDFVFLSSELLAIASEKDLHFIKVSH